MARHRTSTPWQDRPAPPSSWSYTLADIARASGLPVDLVEEHVTAGLLTPGDLKSVSNYLEAVRRSLKAGF